MKTALVTCHFNPCGYSRPVQNYWRFREALPEGVNLTTVELSFSGEFEIPDSIQLKADPDLSVMWQKERLLNVGIESLDGSFDSILWVDADFIFRSPTWLEDTERLLKRFPAVQPFERLHMLDQDDLIESSMSSYAYKHYNPAARWKKPGGAWAYRREVLPSGGLYDKNVIGGGDQVMVASSVGDWGDAAFSLISGAYKEAALAWGREFYSNVKGSIGCTHGDALHLFHGTRENRNYSRRHEILNESEFDPSSDIKVGSCGAWEWSTNKTEIIERAKVYFKQRGEDN